MTGTETQHFTLKVFDAHIEQLAHFWLLFCSEMRNKCGIFSVITHKHIFSLYLLCHLILLKGKGGDRTVDKKGYVQRRKTNL